MAKYGGFGGLTTGGGGKKTPKVPKPKAPTPKYPSAVLGGKGVRQTARQAGAGRGTSVSATTGAAGTAPTAPPDRTRVRVKPRSPTPRQQARRQIRKQVRRRLTSAARRSATSGVPSGVPKRYRGAVREFGPLVDEAAEPAGLTGTEYLAKTLKFESNFDEGAVSSAGARKLGQFMPGTRATFKSQYGVDPWGSPKDQIKGAAMHLSGRFGHAPGYAGYNPGYSGSDPIPSVDVGRTQPTEKVPKRLKKRAKGMLGPKQTKAIVSTAKEKAVTGPRRLSGAWGGAKRAVLSKLSSNARAEGRGDKRTPAENSVVGGAGDSDHLITNRRAYAADIPPDPREYARLRRELGLPLAKSGSDTVVKDGYRYQLIYGAEYDHGDHIHLGAEWVGAGVPEGTMLGGFGGATTGGPTTTGGETQAAPRTARARKATTTKRRKRQRRQEETRRRVLSLIAEDPELATVRFTPSRESYSTYVKRQPTKVRLAA